MAKPNYSFEKRQRELAKKKKKEDKARDKAERKAHPGSDGEFGASADDALPEAVGPADEQSHPALGSDDTAPASP